MSLGRGFLTFALVAALGGCRAPEPRPMSRAGEATPSATALVAKSAVQILEKAAAERTAVSVATAPADTPATTSMTVRSVAPTPSPATLGSPTSLAPVPAGRTINVAVGSPVGDALAHAGPGDTVLLAPGVHHGPVFTGRAGTAAAPIRITGPGATLTGVGHGRLVEIRHSHVVLEGLTITNADILVWVENATGVRILGNTLMGAGSECVRVKYRSSANEIAHNRIDGCGLTDFDLARGDKNGEGIYIGTAPEQLGKNPTPEPDRSDHNWVHHNRVSARAECVDVKEAATGNRIEANACTGSLDPDGAGYSSRGIGTVFVGNTATGLVGAGIRLGGDADQDGTGSEVRANVLTGNRGYGLKVQRFPQGPLCGNDVTSNERGPTNGGVDPSIPC